MLRPWLLQGVEPVIVHVPRKTDIIWVGVFFLASEVWTDLQRRHGSNQVCLWARVSPHSCVVRRALAWWNWRSGGRSVQYSTVLFGSSDCEPLISDLLDCNYMICTESHTFIHVSLRWFSGRGSGEVSREPRKRQFRKTSAFRFNPFEFGLTEALLLSLITMKTDTGGPPQPTLPLLSDASGSNPCLAQAVGVAVRGGRGWGRAACPGVAAWSESWAGAASLVSGEYHLGEPDEGVSLCRGPQHADLPGGLLTVVLRQVVGLLYAVTLRQPINQGPKVRDSVIDTYLFSGGIVKLFDGSVEKLLR